MPKKLAKKHLLMIAVILVSGTIGTAAILAYIDNHKNTSVSMNPEKSSPSVSDENKKPTADSVEYYQGISASVANDFTIKVPNGWRASISESTNFLAIMFARPNQLESLVYNADNAPTIDRGGIPSWNGLTEHFFVIKPTAAQAFNPDQHLEVSSRPFTFNDGTVGQSYYVVKHANEAQKWGGLQKDTEWQGRTYIYEKDGKKVEAHLALYPSSGISISFFEDVIRTVSRP